MVIFHCAITVSYSYTLFKIICLLVASEDIIHFTARLHDCSAVYKIQQGSVSPPWL